MAMPKRQQNIGIAPFTRQSGSAFNSRVMPGSAAATLRQQKMELDTETVRRGVTRAAADGAVQPAAPTKEKRKAKKDGDNASDEAIGQVQKTQRKKPVKIATVVRRMAPTAGTAGKWGRISSKSATKASPRATAAAYPTSAITITASNGDLTATVDKPATKRISQTPGLHRPAAGIKRGRGPAIIPPKSTTGGTKSRQKLSSKHQSVNTDDVDGDYNDGEAHDFLFSSNTTKSTPRKVSKKAATHVPIDSSATPIKKRAPSILKKPRGPVSSSLAYDSDSGDNLAFEVVDPRKPAIPTADSTVLFEQTPQETSRKRPQKHQVRFASPSSSPTKNDKVNIAGHWKTATTTSQDTVQIREDSLEINTTLNPPTNTPHAQPAFSPFHVKENEDPVSASHPKNTINNNNNATNATNTTSPPPRKSANPARKKGMARKVVPKRSRAVVTSSDDSDNDTKTQQPPSKKTKTSSEVPVSAQNKNGVTDRKKGTATIKAKAKPKACVEYEEMSE